MNRQHPIERTAHGSTADERAPRPRRGVDADADIDADMDIDIDIDDRGRSDLQRAGEEGRGRRAEAPSEIPAAGWKDVARRVKAEAREDNLPLLSAGVAFYALLSLFPALAAVVSIYGIVADPSEVSRQLRSLTRALPSDAAHLIVQQARDVAGTSNGSLGITVVVGIVLALWSASSGMKWLMAALSLVYDEREERKFVKLRGTAVLLTIGAAVGLVISIGLISAMPAICRHLGLGAAGTWVAVVLRWPVLAALVVAGLAVLYRYGPNRDRARWRWVTWGSGLAAVIWLVASAAFAAYAAVAGRFAKTYGSVAGVVVLMLWLYLSILAILLGGEINAEMEHQTAADTTVGPSRPLGARGAEMADTVGPTEADDPR
ncbi:MAG: ribonuclease [Acidimicrobiales bacterium]|nr:ribonuclease [Acidimicrobiales bacterium]